MPYTLAEDLEAAAAAGFRHVEIWAGKVEAYLGGRGPGVLRTDLQARGLSVAAICPYGLRLFGDWRAGVSSVARGAALAAEIGCPLLLVCPDAPGAEESGADVWEVAGERARAYADAAAACGVRLAIEPLGGHRFVPGAAQALRLLRAARHPALGVMMDTFHYHKSGVTQEDLAAVPPALWAILHINDVPAGDPRAFADGDRLYPGEGVLPLAETLGFFRGLGYAGAVSVEVFRKSYWEQPIGEINRRAYDGVMAALRAAGA